MLKIGEFARICRVNRRTFRYHIMSKSEEAFFGSVRDMKKNYLKPMYKKRFRELK